MDNYVVITGGAGYIGSHTAVELYKGGYTPIIIDNFSNTTIDNIRGIENIINQEIKYFDVDCTDTDKLYDTFKSIGKGIVGVIHFAAFKSVGDSVINPEKYHINNVGSMESLIHVMDTLGITNLIFSSSCTVYGNPDILPVTEETPFKSAQSPYGETKQKCEILLNCSSLASVSLRYFNPIGSHKSTLIGDRSTDKPSNLVPIICKSITNNTKMLVYGNDYETKDGTCVRDYIHVVDLAKSHVAALKHLMSRQGKYTYNVGTGNGISVLDVIKTFEDSNDIKIDYEVGSRRVGDVVEVYADCSKINKELNWSAEKTLETCMVDSWNWEECKWTRSSVG